MNLMGGPQGGCTTVVHHLLQLGEAQFRAACLAKRIQHCPALFAGDALQMGALLHNILFSLRQIAESQIFKLLRRFKQRGAVADEAALACAQRRRNR